MSTASLLPRASERAVFEALKAGLDARAGGRIVAASTQMFPTGFAELDQALGGGFIRGALATLEGPPTSGRTAVLAGALAQATRHGLAAVVDAPAVCGEIGAIYPPDFERAGVQLERTLIVSAQNTLEIARCADILLRSRAFAAVAMPAAALRAAVWSRLCGLAQKAGAMLFVLGAGASTELAYFASTRVRCTIDRVLWSGMSGILSELNGYELNAQVLKHRRAAPGSTARLRIAEAVNS